MVAALGGLHWMDDQCSVQTPAARNVVCLAGAWARYMAATHAMWEIYDGE